jgi:hypothetical protein
MAVVIRLRSMPLRSRNSAVTSSYDEFVGGVMGSFPGCGCLLGRDGVLDSEVRRCSHRLPPVINSAR